MQITLVLHNIRSTYNVGAILRSAEGFGVEKIYCSGYTPCHLRPDILPHLAEKLQHQITKTAVGADSMVNMLWSNNILETISAEKAAGATVIGLENNISDSRLIRLSELSQALQGLSEPQKQRVVLILGEEVDGISQELYNLIDIFAEIPMRGQKESLNVSVAAGIALYELRR